MAEQETKRPLPPNWADDSLTGFIEQAFGNTLATFVNKPAEFELLCRLDQAFFRIASNLHEPQDLIAALFLMRSHSAYRAACRMAMSGQITESFPVLRSYLESSLYAIHINQNPDLGEIWIRRHDDEESMRTVKREFTVRNVKNTLAATDNRLSQIIDDLYERTIDFGAHPNERAITGSMTMTHDDGCTEIQQIYLHGDSLALDHGIKTTAQIGLGSLSIFQNIFPERFQILGISAEIDQLQRVL